MYVNIVNIGSNIKISIFFQVQSYFFTKKTVALIYRVKIIVWLSLTGFGILRINGCRLQNGCTGARSQCTRTVDKDYAVTPIRDWQVTFSKVFIVSKYSRLRFIGTHWLLVIFS